MWGRLIFALAVALAGCTVFAAIILTIVRYFLSAKRCIGCRWFADGFCTQLMTDADDLDLACDIYEDKEDQA